MFKLLFLISSLSFFSILCAQSSMDSQHNVDWQNLDPESDNIQGVSVEKAYNEFLKYKKSTPVIVAVIDAGVDINHEDLKGNIWTNKGEIPDNGIDDDHNGFIDDVHGWNFIGNVKYESYEVARLYKKYNEKFNNKKIGDISPADTAEYHQFEAVREDYFKKLNKEKKNFQKYAVFLRIYHFSDSLICSFLKKENYDSEALNAIIPNNDTLAKAKAFMVRLNENGFTKENYNGLIDYYNMRFKYHLNPDFDARNVVGDDPLDYNDSIYGNNDVKGPAPDHGTGVSGIIAAVRDNNIGVDGIADDVKIMVVRVVPDGDERDKDVANGIKYAIRNGAKVINMSFGKNFSPQKAWVDEAVKLANKYDVLLIHAAGNDAEDDDIAGHFPNKYGPDSSLLTENWITVGASDSKANKKLVADFSNYGKKSVDIFAPGVDIYAVFPENKYKTNSGTSFSAPVVTGMAAVIRSYYPELSAKQVKDLILESSIKYKRRVYLPNLEENKKSKKVKFNTLSVSGGVANLYNAIKEMENKK